MGKFALLVYMSEVSTKSFVVLIRGSSKLNHLGAQGTLNPGGYPHLATNSACTHLLKLLGLRVRMITYE